MLRLVADPRANGPWGWAEGRRSLVAMTISLEGNTRTIIRHGGTTKSGNLRHARLTSKLYVRLGTELKLGSVC